MSFRRPKLPKIGKEVPKPKKSLRKIPKKPLTAKASKHPPKKPLRSKKKKTAPLGTCFGGLKCTGKILSRKVTKNYCKKIGGKSWKGSKGCEQIKRD